MGERLPSLTIAPVAAETAPVDALRAAAEDAPYLARLLTRRPDIVDALADGDAEACFADVRASIACAVDQSPAEASTSLRRAKEAAHLITAGADLSGAWSVARVTDALTDFADAAVGGALAHAYKQAAARGEVDDMPIDACGLFVIAMGKMGAGELNYSSDIDVIALYDETRFRAASRSAKEVAVRIVRDVVQLLETRTEHGYVFRTDLRLRPDPGSTAIAMSAAAALSYYEGVGQNWERMAYIKARPCGGDLEAATEFLAALKPYIWRRHLDYWAIADIHAIKRQIHATGRHADVEAKAFDVKLGRGGIREIEFFAQTQQLILGGRNPDLRARGTVPALQALAEATAITPQDAEDLGRAYYHLRALEHRIQMINDEQTHLLSDAPDARMRIAKLCGVDTDVFEADVAAVRSRVHGAYSELFAQEERLSGEAGNLVFTGVEDDPDTLETLRQMGFSSPETVTRTVRAWHRGGVGAARTARGRQLLTVLTPRLLHAISDAGEPDAAFGRFNEFLGGLRGGVQALSLMLAEPALTADLIATMSYAPKLARDLARRPALLDAMMDARFRSPVDQDPQGGREADLRLLISASDGFEDALNVARRFHREDAFRTGYQLLRGDIHAAEAGAAYADLAEACVCALADAAKAEVERRFGPWSAKWAVCALGKLGGREMTATSDLDIMVVYAPDAGGEDLAARFTQRLISALSAPTEEGALYEVDMQLRPSGRAGPVAVKLSAFESYYREQAWTWEFMALTRMRPIAGDEELCNAVADIARDAIRRRADYPALDADVLDMRRRLARERPPSSKWDVKLAPGGVIDIEFVVQHAVLKMAGDEPGCVRANTLEAIEMLRGGGLTAEEADALRRGLSLQLNLQQALRIADGDRFDPQSASAGLKAWIAKVLDFQYFSDLSAALDATHAAVEQIRLKKIGSLATES